MPLYAENKFILPSTRSRWIRCWEISTHDGFGKSVSFFLKNCRILNEVNLADCIFRYVKEHSDASTYDLKFLKDFVTFIAFDINRTEHNSDSAEEIVRVYWKNLELLDITVIKSYSEMSHFQRLLYIYYALRKILCWLSKTNWFSTGYKLQVA